MAVPAAAPAVPHHFSNSSTGTDLSEGPVNPLDNQDEIADTCERRREFNALDIFRSNHYLEEIRKAKLLTRLRVAAVVATLPVSLPLSLAIKLFNRRFKSLESFYKSISSEGRYINDQGEFKLRQLEPALRVKVVSYIAFSAFIRNCTTQAVRRSKLLEKAYIFSLEINQRKIKHEDQKRTEFARILMCSILKDQYNEHNSNLQSSEILLDEITRKIQETGIETNNEKVNQMLEYIKTEFKNMFDSEEWKLKIATLNSDCNEEMDHLFNELLKDKLFENNFQKLKDEIPLKITRNIGQPNGQPLRPDELQFARNLARIPLSFISKWGDDFNQSILNNPHETFEP